MKTAQLKTRWELFKFRSAIIFYSSLTLLFISIFAILKISQVQDYPQDTLASVARVQGCVFIDKLKLADGIGILSGCRGYGRFLKIPEIGKPHARLIYSPIYSLLTVFAIFGLVLQNQKRKSNEHID
jgi:hypothetical protein